MLKFESLADGNCLYNTEVIALVLNFQAGNLDRLIHIKDFRQNVGKLLKKVIAQEIDKELSETLRGALGKLITATSVPRAMNALINKLTKQKDAEKEIDWIALQNIMSYACRALVIDYLVSITRASRGQKCIQYEVKKELKQALDQSLEISLANGAENEEIEISSHFNDMEEITNKIREIRDNSSIPDLKDKQEALNQWFFEGDAPGFQFYLYGEKGIAKSGIQAGTLEYKILTHLFHHKINFYSPGLINPENCQTIYEFKTKKLATQVTALTFEVEKYDDHWNLLLPNIESNIAMIGSYGVQRGKYIENKEAEKKREINQANLAQFGSYKKHHQQEVRDCTIKEYCLIMGLSLEEYTLSGEHDQEELQDYTPEPAVQRNLLLEVSQKIKKTSKPTPPPRAIANEFDPVDYICMLLTLISLSAFAIHFVVNPVLFPFLTYLFAQTVIAPYIEVIVAVSTILFSTMVSLVITEKYQQENENGFFQSSTQAKAFAQEASSQNKNSPSKSVRAILNYYENRNLNEKPFYVRSEHDQTPAGQKRIGLK